MRWILGALVALACTSATRAQAFCGFYVKENDTRITSRASRVVLLRDGTTTVLTMQNSYEGPPEDFALIVPVPSPVGPEDVRTLERDVLERVDELSSPRLVEYWEQAPYCLDGMSGFGMSARGYGMGGGGGHVTVEARFAAGEYDVVILSAEDSTDLDRWLRDEGYRVPDGAAAALRPYVEQGFRFFAARVNAARVRFGADGNALLSPLRIRTESSAFVLPVRLGMLSSPGTQDLIVYVLSREGRFEVANRANATVPTNLVVRGTVRGRFGAFYDALLDRVWAREPGAVITEYAWTAAACDPCPGPPMSASDLTSLGGDVATGAQQQVAGAQQVLFGPTRVLSGPRPDRPVSAMLEGRRRALLDCVERPHTFALELTVRGREVTDARVDGSSAEAQCVARALRVGASSDAAAEPASRVRLNLHVARTVSYAQPSAHGFTLTRLRYRYGTSSPATDLVFRAAPPIAGGDGAPDERGRLDPSVRRTNVNGFQARYAILHRRLAPPEGRCRSWGHGGWGEPPSGAPRTGTARALAPSGAPVRLEHLLRSPVPSLGLRPGRPPEPPPRRSKAARPKALDRAPE
ncbi:MAG: DUF2330 domain-containing protein [Sandaracinaceae bacterium]|nr:DUF2330 domain-containing protein [Sandaracinaceae bacterium]